jgi:hypothetical protein
LLEWLPDQRGWLVHGALIDRETGHVMLKFDEPPGSIVRAHLVDKNQIVGIVGSRKELVTMEIPWEKINASMKLLKDPKAVVAMSPNQPISLKFELVNPRGDVQETRKLVIDTIAKRLQQEGITIADGQSTVLHVKMTEKAGDTLSIYQTHGFELRGQDTGKTVTASKAELTMELKIQGRDTPVWTTSLTENSMTSFQGEVNDAIVRKSMLDFLVGRLMMIDPPNFVPADQQAESLPIRIR